MGFFEDDDYFTGPGLTDELVGAAEERLGVKLPKEYITLLGERNGGKPSRRCFPMTEATSWAADHIEIAGIRGLAGEWGIDTDMGLGSHDMIAEWEYPQIGVVLCEMPSGGHDAVMLDYSECGGDGEPAVAYVDEDRVPRRIADSFAEFVRGLVDCSKFRGA